MLASLVWGQPVYATYRADFFDTSKRPTVTFDKKSLTWTLRNQSVERVIHFDAAVGGLQTVGLRDLHTRHILLPAPDSEGEFSFAAPLLQAPVPLTGWKSTFTAPGPAWTQPGFDDAAWGKPSALPPVGATCWSRVALTADRLKAGHAYALCLLDASEMEVYADGVLIYKRTASDLTYTRSAQIDLPPGCRVLAAKSPQGEPLNACLAEVGTSPPALNLSDGWQCMMYTLNAGEDNSQILTIRLSGVKQHEGFELDVNYQIYAGEEPTLAKWFSFVTHRRSRFLIEAVTCDRWRLPDGLKARPHPTSGFSQRYVPSIASDPLSGDLLMTAQIASPMFKPLSADGKTLAPNAKCNVLMTPELPCATPRTITAFWHGPESVGAFLHQLYIGQYIARGGPQAVPIAYTTENAYPDDLFNAATCKRIIPLAAALGAQAFVLDDGWQSNITPDTGRYGDWIADKEKFPGGLLPISLLARENHLRFGLWIEATRANARSQAATKHPEWLVKTAATDSEGNENDTRMCFTGAWARQFTQSIAALCREQSVNYVKTSYSPVENCMATLHEHPTGHSGSAEQENWKAFCDALTATDKTMAVTGYSVTNRHLEAQDSINRYYWRLGKPDLKVQPDLLRQMEFWLRDAAAWLHPRPVEAGFSLYNDTDLFALPSFVQDGQALCHLPLVSRPIPEQSEYMWSSVAAFNCNFEIRGDLEQMTSDERAIGHKWIDWNLQNREWLAFTQPLALASADLPPDRAVGDKREGVSGLLHLRNALHGRYGYVCLWNLDDSPHTVTPAFNPGDYFVRLRAGDVKLSNIKDGSAVSFTMRGGTVSLDKITLPPQGWAIYEISAK